MEISGRVFSPLLFLSFECPIQRNCSGLPEQILTPRVGSRAEGARAALGEQLRARVHSPARQVLLLRPQVRVYPEGIECSNTTVLPLIGGIWAHTVSVLTLAPIIISSYFKATRKKQQIHWSLRFSQQITSMHMSKKTKNHKKTHEHKDTRVP